MKQPVVTNSLKLLTRLLGASVVPGWLQPGNSLIVLTPQGGGGGENGRARCLRKLGDWLTLKCVHVWESVTKEEGPQALKHFFSSRTIKKKKRRGTP